MSIAQFLYATAKTWGERPAIAEGERVVQTYADLASRTARLAGALKEQYRLQPGDRIAVYMANCSSYIEIMWAIWWAGGCFVPINAKLHGKEAAWIIANSEAGICFTDGKGSDALTPHQAEAPCLKHLIEVEQRQYLSLFSAEQIQIIDAEMLDPAWLFYTSGTTGKPKGAILTHRSLTAMTLGYFADIDQLSITDTIYLPAPLSHAAGLYSLPGVAKGATLLVPESHAFDVAETYRLIGKYTAVSFFAAPTMVSRLVDGSKKYDTDFSHIRTLMYGGAPMYLEDLMKALDVVGPRLCQLYAQGESPCTGTILSKYMHADAESPQFRQRLSSVGIARTGVAIKILNEDGRELASGEIGEIALRSDVTMSGYWQNPKATAETLRNGWLHTGDVGEMTPDGFLILRDRSKDVIISGGTNIYPREVEEVLLRHPAVREVSVVGRPSAEWGEEVVAFLSLIEGASVSPDELDALCMSEIARFKRPKEYKILSDLPKSNYGKILKIELRKFL